MDLNNDCSEIYTTTCVKYNNNSHDTSWDNPQYKDTKKSILWWKKAICQETDDDDDELDIEVLELWKSAEEDSRQLRSCSSWRSKINITWKRCSRMWASLPSLTAIRYTSSLSIQDVMEKKAICQETDDDDDELDIEVLE